MRRAMADAYSVIVVIASCLVLHATTSDKVGSEGVSETDYHVWVGSQEFLQQIHKFGGHSPGEDHGAEVECQREHGPSGSSGNELRSALLAASGCGGGDRCARLTVSAGSNATLRHPQRFGVFELVSAVDGYPAYRHASSGQHLFFQHEFEEWQYAHKIHRWIIGSTIGKAEGGVLILSKFKCPWLVDFSRVETYIFSQRTGNTWNPRGNGWTRDASVSIKCLDHAFATGAFACRCAALNVSSQVIDVSGLYSRAPSLEARGFLAPVFRRETTTSAGGGRPLLLYSHHPKGRLWQLGSSFLSWSARLDLSQASADSNEDLCPDFEVEEAHEDLPVNISSHAVDHSDNKIQNETVQTSNVSLPLSNSSDVNTNSSISLNKPNSVKKSSKNKSGNNSRSSKSRSKRNVKSKQVTRPKWEILAGFNGADEVWQQDPTFRVECIKKDIL